MIDIETHAAAFIAAIQSADRTLRIHDGGVPDKATRPYVVVYFGSGLLSSEALCDNYEDRAEFDVTTYAVGDTPKHARWVASRVNAVSGKELTVAGRSSIVKPILADDMRRSVDDPLRPTYELRSGFTVISLAH